MLVPAVDFGRLEQVFVLTSYTTTVVGGGSSGSAASADPGLSPVIPTAPANPTPNAGVIVGVG
jgi:hypothetical protein